MFDSGSDSRHPDWWPYAAELPGWEVWRDVDQLYYARRVGSTPPVVVRGEDAVDLRDMIRAEIYRALE